MSAADLKRLTPAHRAALNAFARKHGRAWRSKLLTLRERGGYGIEGDLVHAVNIVGPSGIRAYKVSVANPGRKRKSSMTTKRKTTAKRRAPQRNPAPPRGPRMDAFTRAYIEAAIWSSTDDNGDPMDRNYDEDDLAGPTLLKMKRDCAKFQRENADDLSAGTSSQGGHDFWLTRVGHGAGYWDGDWPEPEASRLTAAAERFGNVDLYVGDNGKIHESTAHKRAVGKKSKAGRKTATRKKAPSRKVANPRKPHRKARR